MRTCVNGIALAFVGLALVCGCERASRRSAAATAASSPGRAPHDEPLPEPDDSPMPAVVLAAGEHAPVAMASHADRLYWGTAEEGSGPSIRSVSKSGGAAETLVAIPRQLDLPGALRHGARIDSLFVDSEWMFFSVIEWESFADPGGEGPRFEYAGGIYRAPRSGGAAELSGVPVGAAEGVPFAADDAFFYFRAFDSSSVAIAAIRKDGGGTSMIRLDSPDGPQALVDSIALDADHWYVSISEGFGAPHAHCVARGPRMGGVLENVWCPSFMVVSLAPVGGMLAAVNPWPWTDGPGAWVVDLASGRARSVARSGPDKEMRAVVADELGGRLFAVEKSPGNGILFASSDLVRIDLATGARRVLDHQEDPAPPHGWFFADARSVYFTRGGEILRIDH